MERKYAEYEAAAVQKISMKLDCANLRVLESGDETQIRLEADVDEMGRFESFLDGDTLWMKYEWKRKLFCRQDNQVQITLLLPNGKQFDQIALEVGAGNAELSQTVISCNGFALKVGAGNLNAGRIEIADCLKAEIGAGNVNIQSTTADNVEVDCGVGKCILGLDGMEQDYNYDISCGVGKIQINNSSIKQLGGREKRNNAQAKGTVKLECGVGKIEIHTH